MYRNTKKDKNSFEKNEKVSENLKDKAFPHINKNKLSP